MGKDNTLLWVGGGAVVLIGGYYLINKNNAVTALPGATNTAIPGAPTPPLTYNDAYYKTYQYPALVKANPNLINSNYQLTATDAANYLNNYLELQQWLPTVLKNFNNSQQQALQYHWSHYGVPQQYSFIPFVPPKNANWIPPPPNPNSSGSSGVLSTVGTVASIAAMFLGPNDQVLNDGEVELIVTMSPVTNDILKFYLKSDKPLVDSIQQKLNELIVEYAF